MERLKEYTPEEREEMRKRAILRQWHSVQALPAIYMTESEFGNLREYSCSLPTGTTIGKRWKKDAFYHFAGVPKAWILCEYYDIGDPNKVGIRYYQIRLKGIRIPAL